jgi:hypothetical protein
VEKSDKTKAAHKLHRGRSRKLTEKEVLELRRAAFKQGAYALRSFIVQESERLSKLLADDKSVFAKGQLDGIQWLEQSVTELFEA